jgi:uncharacterized NAD-dependent epimerase/dehydratase family protein
MSMNGMGRLEQLDLLWRISIVRLNNAEVVRVVTASGNHIGDVPSEHYARKIVSAHNKAVRIASTDNPATVNTLANMGASLDQIVNDFYSYMFNRAKQESHEDHNHDD